jgi:hypothetical protein
MKPVAARDIKDTSIVSIPVRFGNGLTYSEPSTNEGIGFSCYDTSQTPDAPKSIDKLPALPGESFLTKGAPQGHMMANCDRMIRLASS